MSNANIAEEDSVAVIVAEEAEQVNHEEYNQRYLILQNGRRYDGTPGSLGYRVTSFKT